MVKTFKHLFRDASSDSYVHAKHSTYIHIEKKVYNISILQECAACLGKYLTVKLIAYVLQQQYFLELK